MPAMTGFYPERSRRAPTHFRVQYNLIADLSRWSERLQKKKGKSRITVPPDLAAKILFLSDRTCCVCRTQGKLIQIHHIDGNPANNRQDNLSVLCTDCHNLTMIKGGFHRTLSPDQVRLYRDDWLVLVARSRAGARKEPPNPEDTLFLELATSEAEILRENKQYELLAQHYDVIGNTELRDKYIRKALQKRPRVSPLAEIELRALQGKTHLVPAARVRAAIKILSEPEQLSQLARLYADLGDWALATKTYCEDIAKMIEDGNLFSAAFYAKEFAERHRIKETCRARRSLVAAQMFTGARVGYRDRRTNEVKEGGDRSIR